ncbi:MAG: hypothetical protein AAGM67_18620 [Bacteroidota bacterium]
MAISFNQVLAQAEVMVNTNPLTKGELLELEEVMSQKTQQELEQELKEMEKEELEISFSLPDWNEIQEDIANFNL